jgi:hypothetical protein
MDSISRLPVVNALGKREAGGGGILLVETVGRIRREHFVKGKSIKQFVRELEVSRNTVRKVLRSRATC